MHGKSNCGTVVSTGSIAREINGRNGRGRIRRDHNDVFQIPILVPVHTDQSLRGKVAISPEVNRQSTSAFNRQIEVAIRARLSLTVLWPAFDRDRDLRQWQAILPEHTTSKRALAI